MDYQSVLTGISTVGFPIIACIYLIKKMDKTEERYTDTINKLKETIDNNTKAMIKIACKLGVDTDGK